MNVRILSIAITLPLLISGCASWGWNSDVKKIDIQTRAVERTRLDLKTPKPFAGRDVQWIVVTPKNAEQVWARLKEKNVDVVMFAVTDEGYEQLALTMAELRNIIAQQNSIIIKYKEYYEPEQEKK